MVMHKRRVFQCSRTIETVHLGSQRLLRLISIHKFPARAAFLIEILQPHCAYQITLQMHLLKMRALQSSHWLPNRNVFQGGKASSLLALKAKITAVIVRVAMAFASEIS